MIMFGRLRKLLTGNRSFGVSDGHEETSIGTTTPESAWANEYSIDSLWDSYEERIYEYSPRTYNKLNVESRLEAWLGSISSSGFTREHYLRYLISSYQLGDENRILLRLSDWVREVQSIADEWVVENFSKLPMSAVKSNQKLILYLSRKRRVQEQKGFSEIKRDLLARAQMMDLKEFSEFDVMFRRFLYRLSLDRDTFLRRWILDDKDPGNRLILAQALGVSALTEDEVLKLLRDKSVFVRRRFAYMLAVSEAGVPEDLLLVLAKDVSSSLRQFAQFYLKRDYGVDVYSIYSQMKGDDFYYIADYARADDVDVFVRGANSGNRRYSLICLKALMEVAPEMVSSIDLGSLLQQNRKVRELLLPSIAKYLPVEEVHNLEVAFVGNTAYGSAGFLSLVEHISLWHLIDVGLGYLLNGAPEHVEDRIRDRIRYVATSPAGLSLELRQSIEGKLKRLKQSASRGRASLIKDVEFLLETS